MRRLTILAALSLALLAACKQESGSGQRQTEPAAVDAKPGITLSAARMALPAVKGNPAAAYFTLANTGQSAVAIAAVSLTGAGRTDLHEVKDGAMQGVTSVNVDAGATVSFAPGGLHVMAFDLDPKLAPGQRGELTVTFADGDKISAPMEILPPGGQAAHQAGAHGEGH